MRGYVFDGWNPSVEVNVTQNQTYTAQWKVADYRIQYVLDGGANDSRNLNTYMYGIGVTSFADATKSGYDFLGWYDAAGVRLIAISMTEVGNKILYARWSQVPGTVYTVEHYLEQSDGTFQLEDTELLQEATDKVVKATPKTYTGFYYDNTIIGTLVLKQYYSKSPLNVIGKPSKTTGTKGSSFIRTGDSTSTIFYLELLGLSLLGITYLFVRKKGR